MGENVIIALELWGAVIGIIFAVSCWLASGGQGKSFKLLGWIELAVAGLLASNAINLQHDGAKTLGGLIVLESSLFTEFLCDFILITEFVLYFEMLLKSIGNLQFHRRANLIMVLELVCLILLILSQWNGCLYYLDENNYYHRGPWFVVAPAICLFALLLFLSAVLQYHKYFTRRQLIFYVVIWLIAMTGGILGVLIQEIPMINIGVGIDGIIIFVAVRVNELEFVRSQEKKLKDSQVELMLSQIGPHFLFNSLSTIKYLCLKNPGEAAEAVDDLSFYLRANIDSIGLKNCISFTKELEHAKNYMNLEQRRFGDKIKIEYELEELDFVLPPLTLQPMVENAIKHGLAMKEEGGTVWVCTRRDGKEIVLTIRDDGLGFDLNTPKNDGREHVGIVNVRYRLEMMCGGTLHISSLINRGTEVIIRVPMI